MVILHQLPRLHSSIFPTKTPFLNTHFNLLPKPKLATKTTSTLFSALKSTLSTTSEPIPIPTHNFDIPEETHVPISIEKLSTRYRCLFRHCRFVEYENLEGFQSCTELRTLGTLRIRKLTSLKAVSKHRLAPLMGSLSLFLLVAPTSANPRFLTRLFDEKNSPLRRRNLVCCYTLNLRNVICKFATIFFLSL